MSPTRCAVRAERFITCDHCARPSKGGECDLSDRSRPFGRGDHELCIGLQEIRRVDQNLITNGIRVPRARGGDLLACQKKATCIYSQLKTCSSSESQRDYGSHPALHGDAGQAALCRQPRQSEVLWHVPSARYELFPASSDPQSKLYLPESDQASVSRAAPVLTRAIDWTLIAQQYDELVKYATAVQIDGRRRAILARFTPTRRIQPTRRCGIGTVIKTSSCAVSGRRNVAAGDSEGLNVVENWNSANSFIFYGRYGELSSNRRDDQEIGCCAPPLANQPCVREHADDPDVLADPPGCAADPEDFRGLTPLIYAHVNRMEIPSGYDHRLPLAA